MPSPPDLPRTQKLIFTLITAPTGVEPGAAALVSAGRLESTDLSFVIRGDDRLRPAHRLSIYADMYFYRLRDSLYEDFPKVAAVIGGARFHNLVTDYLLVHPSSFWSMRNLGKAFPGFLKGHELAASLLSPVLEMPVELEKEISVLDVPLPTFRELYQLLREIVSLVRQGNKAVVDLTRDVGITNFDFVLLGNSDQQFLIDQPSQLIPGLC